MSGWKERLEKNLTEGRLPLPRWLQRWVLNTPAARNKIRAEQDRALEALEKKLKPYRKDIPTHTQLPMESLSREDILVSLAHMKEREEPVWREGFVSGAVYQGDSDHADFLNRVYSMYSQANPLHPDVWPSLAKIEAEIVSMTAGLFRAPGADENRPCGTVTSGGTESILLAIKTYRDWARAERGIARPQLVAPVTAHVAFEKAAHYFGLDFVRIPVDGDYRADVDAARNALTRDTVALVGSAPGFPHGIVDPIEALSELARERGIGFHTDACLGGFVLPFARKLGYPVPPFDFGLPGVTSMSADTHKFGYASKGTSVLLFRDPAMRRHQYFTTTEWPGGMYASPTLAGSRPGGLSAACWASLLVHGERGYLEATRAILETADFIKREVAAIPDVRIVGDPLWVLAFTSETLDIYRVLDQLNHKGWNLNSLQTPPAFHLCLTLRHTSEGVAQRFVEDLRASIETIRAHPEERSEGAVLYGMAATFPVRESIDDLLRGYLDILYKT